MRGNLPRIVSSKDGLWCVGVVRNRGFNVPGPRIPDHGFFPQTECLYSERNRVIPNQICLGVGFFLILGVKIAHNSTLINFTGPKSMSKKTTESVAAEQAEAVKPIPENLPEELLPLYDWWKEKGARSLVSVGAVALIAVGIMGYMNYRKGKMVEANVKLTQANSVEELEAAVAEFGSFKAGNAARIRLAKAYYDASKYEEALTTYEECESKGIPAGFEDIVTLGRAHCLEAMEKTDDAFKTYKNFTENNKTSFLYPQAVMGLSRVMTLQGNKDEAKKLLEELKAEKTDEPMWEMSIARLEDVIDRYEPRARRSLFDMAEAAEKTLQKKPQPDTVQIPETKPEQDKQ